MPLSKYITGSTQGIPVKKNRLAKKKFGKAVQDLKFKKNKKILKS